MIGAMLVLLVVIGGFVALRAVNRTQPVNPVQPVDYQQTLHYAKQTAGFPVLAPSRLPKGWRATSVSFVPKPVRWHLGMLTGQNQYVGIEQSRSPAGTMVSTYVDTSAARGPQIQIGGRSWRIWTDSGGDTAVVRSGSGVTTLVVTTAGRDVLVHFVRGVH